MPEKPGVSIAAQEPVEGKIGATAAFPYDRMTIRRWVQGASLSGEVGRVKVTPLGEGLHPSEMFVSVETRDGPQDLADGPRAIQNAAI